MKNLVLAVALLAGLGVGTSQLFAGDTEATKDKSCCKDHGTEKAKACCKKDKAACCKDKDKAKDKEKAAEGEKKS